MSRRAGLAALAVLAASLPGCAKKLPPPGGVPDREPPAVSVTRPDSGSVGAARFGALEIEFTEPMNQRTTERWILLGPYARAEKFEWRGNTFRYVLAESLRADRTYVFGAGWGAVDRRGNRLPGATVSHFTTGPAFPPGEIGGTVEARGHAAREVFLWAYREDLGHAPDSTARDFDALSPVRSDGAFRLPGLPVPSRWRLYAFHDANRTLTFEPGTDHLTPLDSVVTLTPEAPAAESLIVVSLDPDAPGIASGVVADSLAPPGVPVRLRAERLPVVPGSPRVDAPVQAGRFQLPLEPGRYRIFLYLDTNRDGRFDDGEEPRSTPAEIDIEPGAERPGLRLVAPPLPPPGSRGEGGGP